jgi:hypothetical protein
MRFMVDVVGAAQADNWAAVRINRGIYAEVHL